jgi:hypothetical protein
MLTGKRAFEGSSAASVIGAILEREAPSVADVAPQALDRTLRRRREKDPENRWQSARDLKFELDWIAAGDFTAPEAIPRRAFLPWIAGAAVVGAAGVAAFAWREKSSAAPARAIRFQLAPLEGAWRERGVIRQSLALSPVGGRVAVRPDCGTRYSRRICSRRRLEVRSSPCRPCEHGLLSLRRIVSENLLAPREAAVTTVQRPTDDTRGACLGRIYVIRSQKIILDTDLAELYQGPARALNQGHTAESRPFRREFHVSTHR